MIDIHELMVGDWVCYNGDDDCNAPVQIMIVDRVNKDAYIDGDWLQEKDIIPIPITEDNLKLNDRVCATGGGEYGYIYKKQVDSLSILIINLGKNNVIVSIKNDEKDRYFTGSLNYIHELQHALRLCGMDEMADNWRA